nr:MAG TPA: hypothetical protein [Bacteriophage sp.]DAF14526.1 MAG TPA: hypothetical protein [Crassvirales sp.]DAL02241.1 MAG TPA: hypothetical protein [Caudoviricetes sp.]
MRSSIKYFSPFFKILSYISTIKSILIIISRLP